jgi:hypothetical protein
MPIQRILRIARHAFPIELPRDEKLRGHENGLSLSHAYRVGDVRKGCRRIEIQWLSWPIGSHAAVETSNFLTLIEGSRIKKAGKNHPFEIT